jgi:4'-phosphopantetheinyl transferase
MELNDIHIWLIDLQLTPEEEVSRFALLSEDEKQRARRFQLAKHQRRFIAARSSLRTILSFYLATPPEAIQFIYSEHHKPFLAPAHHSSIQFNLTHSSDTAVIAVNKQFAVGVDIEKMKPKEMLPLAKRFFSQQEYTALSTLPAQEQITAFYRLWSRKEALIKAVGKGLFIPLSSFSVSHDDKLEEITLENERWSLVTLPLLKDYQTALACQQTINTVSLWHLFDQKPSLDKVYKW